MENQRPSIEDIIGNTGDPRRSVVEEFAKSGIVVFPSSVSRIRSGERSGIDIQRRLEDSEVLQADDSSRKIDFYVQMLGLGIVLRRTRVNSQKSYTSVGLINEIGEQLDIDPKLLRHSIRSMRADIAYEEHITPGSGLVDFMDDAVDDFEQRTGNRKIVPGLSQVINDWNLSEKKHISDFYKLLYSKGRPSVASWTTYEIPALFDYFSFQESGKLSRLDERILRSYTRDDDRGSLAREVRDLTGVPIDEETLTIHRNLLVHGQPVGQR